MEETKAFEQPEIRQKNAKAFENCNIEAFESGRSAEPAEVVVYKGRLAEHHLGNISRPMASMVISLTWLK